MAELKSRFSVEDCESNLQREQRNFFWAVVYASILFVAYLLLTGCGYDYKARVVDIGVKPAITTPVPPVEASKPLPLNPEKTTNLLGF